MVTWYSQDGEDPSGTGVKAQIFAADGSDVGGEFLVNTEIFSIQQGAAITALVNGGFVVTWYSQDGEDPLGTGIKAQVFAADGSMVGGEILVNTETTNNQLWPEITGLANGGFVVTWWSNDGEDPSGTGIKAQIFNADGSTPTYGVTDEDTAYTIPGAVLLANDSDPDGDAIVISAVSAMSTLGATVTVSGGDVIYDPTGAATLDALAEGETLEDSFTYTISDGNGGFDAATVTLTVSGVNDAPVAVDDAFTVTEDTPSNLDLLVNDTDVEGETLTLATIDGTAVSTGDIMATPHGSLQVQSDGSVDYTPEADYSGSDSFTYTTTDGTDPSTAATVTIDVTPVADTPSVALTSVAGAGGDLSPVPSGMDVQVNTTTASTQRYGKVAALENGDFVVTWSSLDQDGAGWGIFSQRFDANGSPLGAETQVNTYFQDFQLYSNVAALPDGGWLVTWSSRDQDGRGYGVFSQRFAADGSPNDGEIQVNTEWMYDQAYSDVKVLNDGGWLVIWSSYDQDGSRYGIYSQRYDTSGNAVGAETQVNTHTSSDQHYGDAAALADGGWLVTWSSQGQDGNLYGIYSQRYDASGSPVGGETQVHTQTANSQMFSDTAVLADGGWVVTWMSAGQDGSDWGIYSQRYGADGTPVGGETLVNTTTVSDQRYSEATALADGGWLVTWSSLDQDGSDWGLYAQRFAADGTPVGAETQVNTRTAGGQVSSGDIGGDNVAQLADGRIVTVYDEGPGTGEIYYVLSDLGPVSDGEQDQPMPVNLTAALADTDGSEELTLTLSGFPAGATFNLGAADGGDWVIENAESLDLSTLTMTPPAGYTGTFPLDATATATETANGDTATATASADFTVAPVCEEFALTDNAETFTDDPGDSCIFGLDGDDTVYGDTNGSYMVNGTTLPTAGLIGNDWIDAGPGTDAVFGDADQLRVYNNKLADALVAGGDDFILAGDGGGSLYGDANRFENIHSFLLGVGVVVAGEVAGGDDVIVGGSGNDTVVGDAWQWSNENYSTGSTGTIRGGDDFILGNGGSNSLHGDAWIAYNWAESNSRGTNIMIGGDDVIYGGSGSGSLYGDAYNFENLFRVTTFNSTDAGLVMQAFGGDDRIETGPGGDRAFGDAQNLGNISSSLSQHTGTLGGTFTVIGGDDTLIGEIDGNLLYGDAQYVTNSGGNAVSAPGTFLVQGGNDTILAGGGTNTVYGDADTLSSTSIRLGTSTVIGGDDTIVNGDDGGSLFGDARLLVASFNVGTTVVVEGGDDDITGGAGAETIYGDADNAETNSNRGTGGTSMLTTGNDTIKAGGGDDTVYGDARVARAQVDSHGIEAIVAGSDILDGGADNDTIFGDFHSVQVFGASASVTMGDDFIDGGMGNDTLWGDYWTLSFSTGIVPDVVTGADTFVFKTASGVDEIMDFEDGTDRIDVSDYGFTQLSDMTLSVGATDTVVDFGGGNQVTIVGVTTLDATDFIFL